MPLVWPLLVRDAIKKDRRADFFTWNARQLDRAQGDNSVSQ